MTRPDQLAVELTMRDLLTENDKELQCKPRPLQKELTRSASFWRTANDSQPSSASHNFLQSFALDMFGFL